MTPKRRERIDKELARIRSRHPGQRCWVCGHGGSLKTSRESYGLRCRTCLTEGKTTPDVLAVQRFHAEIELGHKPRAT